MSECIIELDSKIVIGNVISADGRSAIIRISGRPINVRSGTSARELALYTELERTFHNGVVTAVEDFIGAYSIH